jgi:cleavage and polyadenylation specificity factor subunit 1
MEWIPDVHLEGSLPTRFIPRSRSYSNVIFEPATSLVVAASTLQAEFASFDEDGIRSWDPDGRLFQFFWQVPHLMVYSEKCFIPHM